MKFDFNPKRKPKCRKCGRKMTLLTSESHYYWHCSEHSGLPFNAGIKGQEANFQFAYVVDPVTLKIEKNPYIFKEMKENG